MKIQDMPKIECPFVRVMKDGKYIVTPEIAEGYEWVFEDETVMAIEKLHGTNVSIIIQEGTVIAVFNRTERIPFITKGKKWIIEGLLNSKERGYLEFLGDGQHFGELIGEKVNGNPYKIEGHLWIPFSGFCQKHLKYKSWGKYPKDFKTISNWFKEDLFSLYQSMVHGKDGKISTEEWKKLQKEIFVEGIVFTHPDGRMAKLRKDMFDWFYKQNQKARGHKQ